MGITSAVHKDQLGMAPATAHSKLRQSLLFAFAKQLGLTSCFVCGQPIDNINEFTVEHKIPWLHADNAADLYFTHSNIAFSHSRCNRPHRYNKPVDRSNGDNLRCGRCKLFHHSTRFPVCKRSADGRSNTCYDCRAFLKRERRKRNTKLNTLL